VLVCCGIIDAMTSGIALPNDGAFLELPGTGDGYVSAVICRRPDGSIAWQALPPGGDRDVWVSVSPEGDSVVANSWSSLRVLYDVTTGSEKARHFTK
jgi:hypothetical protein